jgi:hypothetical protein
MPLKTLGWRRSSVDTESVTDANGIAAAEIARDFFALQLRYADVLSARAGIPLAEAIAFNTNLHRLFAYGNLAKQPPDPDFLALIDAALAHPATRVDTLINAYARRPPDPWPADRFPFGRHFACEAPNAEGEVRIHFRNRFNTDEIGPLQASNMLQRRAELTEMFGFVAERWPEAKAVIGSSWLYNTQAYRRLFPAAYAASRTPLLGPRPIRGLSTWGQFLDFRGALKPDVAESFLRNLATLDVSQPWLSFPYQVMSTRAPFKTFRREYGI